MEPAVEVALIGDFCQFTPRAILKTRFFSWLQIESEARFSGWSVPTAGGIPGSRRRQLLTDM